MPHTDQPDFSSYPTDHVVGLLETPQQAAAAVDDLTATGRFSEDDITLLCGPEGRARLDTSGARRGPLGRVLRILQHLGPEHEQLTRYATAIDDGALLIAVNSGTPGKDLATRLLTAHGARDLNYYSHHTIEALTSDANSAHLDPPEVTNLPDAANAVLDRARAAPAGRAATTLTAGAGSLLKQTLLALTADTTLTDHEPPAAATLHVLIGAVQLTTGDQSIELHAGDHTPIPHQRHGLRAHDDAVALLTVATRPATP
jgi:quercetin dioxygenase-like cupin family protein